MWPASRQRPRRGQRRAAGRATAMRADGVGGEQRGVRSSAPATDGAVVAAARRIPVASWEARGSAFAAHRQRGCAPRRSAGRAGGQFRIRHARQARDDRKQRVGVPMAAPLGIFTAAPSARRWIAARPRRPGANRCPLRERQAQLGQTGQAPPAAAQAGGRGGVRPGGASAAVGVIWCGRHRLLLWNRCGGSRHAAQVDAGHLVDPLVDQSSITCRFARSASVCSLVKMHQRRQL